jgi:hypothetical protein
LKIRKTAWCRCGHRVADRIFVRSPTVRDRQVTVSLGMRVGIDPHPAGTGGGVDRKVLMPEQHSIELDDQNVELLPARTVMTLLGLGDGGDSTGSGDSGDSGDGGDSDGGSGGLAVNAANIGDGNDAGADAGDGGDAGSAGDSGDSGASESSEATDDSGDVDGGLL